MSKKNTVSMLVMTALFASLTCVVTMSIRIPSPLNGYLNLGDCVILLAGWLLSPVHGFLAAGIGSALADLFAGYVLYAPMTFVIKGAMALTAFWLFRLLNKRIGYLLSRILSGFTSEAVMILGYFLFESIMYGFAPSSVNIPANGVQGCAGLILGIILIKMLEKTKIISNSNIRSKLS